MKSYFNAGEARRQSLSNGGKLYSSPSLNAAFTAIDKAANCGDFRAIAEYLTNPDVAELRIRGFDVFRIPDSTRFIISW